MLKSYTIPVDHVMLSYYIIAVSNGAPTSSGLENAEELGDVSESGMFCAFFGKY